jgi:hypothetical protein
MSRQWAQKKSGSNSSMPVQKSSSWQRPFTDPIYDAPAPKQTPSVQAKRPNVDWSRVTVEAPSRAGVQAKLTVGATGDKYEQETDAIADQVMAMPAPENRAHRAQFGGNRARKIDQLGQSQLQEIWDNKDFLRSQGQNQEANIVLIPDHTAGGIDGLFEAVKTRLDRLNQKTQPFNLRGRALDTPETGILITEDRSLAKIAWNNKVQVVTPQQLTDPNTKGSIQKHMQKNKLQLIKQGSGYEYYANRYGIRIPREDASSKTGQNLPEGTHNGEYITPVHTLTKPAERGNESKSRDGAMGGFTARNYAIAAGAPKEQVVNTQWEWLHLIAASLGGNNEIGNLVAGTYDGNTRMIPWEQAIIQLSQEINENDPKTYIHLYGKCQTHKNTWLAFTVQLFAANSDGEVVLQSPEIDVYKGIVMDKLEYDIDSYIADMQVTELLAATKTQQCDR